MGKTSPVYSALLAAMDSYCTRTGTPKPTKGATRAQLIGVSPTVLSRIKHGTYPVTGQMARRIAMALCLNEEAQRTLERQLRQSLAQIDVSSAPEVAFVQKFGKSGALLFVEIADVWPYSYGFETPNTPMSLAFKKGMDAGMSVILFVPNRMRPRQGKTDQSMGDGFHEHDAIATLIRLQRMNAERVALYHLVENPCPVPRSGIRLTGLLPHEGPETRWWIANRPNTWHFIPTSRGPEEFLDFFLGNGEIRHGGLPPTQLELEQTWNGWWRSRELPADRPCPIARWTE